MRGQDWHEPGAARPLQSSTPVAAVGRALWGAGRQQLPHAKPAVPAGTLPAACTDPRHILLPCCPSTHPLQVDAEFDVSGKASEAARAAAEAARKVNEAAEDADSKFQFRRRSRILWSDLKRSAPLVRAGDWAGRGCAAACVVCACWEGSVGTRGARLAAMLLLEVAAVRCSLDVSGPQPPLPAVGPPHTRLLRDAARRRHIPVPVPHLRCVQGG